MLFERQASTVENWSTQIGLGLQSVGIWKLQEFRKLFFLCIGLSDLTCTIVVVILASFIQLEHLRKVLVMLPLEMKDKTKNYQKTTSQIYF